MSKKEKNFAGKLKKFFENKGHIVKTFTLKNLSINKSLLENDFYVLKSKDLFFLYAGFYLEANDIPVFPNPDMMYKQKNRIEAHFLIKEAGLQCPEYYFGTFGTLKANLRKESFPLIQKPLVGSGSKGIKLINKIEDLNHENNDLIYLEKYINGTHLLVYFITDEICCLEKEPLSHEHTEMKRIPLSNDIVETINKWKNKYNILFGHLDIVREKNTNQLFIVDPGSFPEFSNWKCDLDPILAIGELILKQITNKN